MTKEREAPFITWVEAELSKCRSEAEKIHEASMRNVTRQNALLNARDAFNSKDQL